MKPSCRAVRIDSVTTLVELVAEHIEAIEPGLSVLDTRPLLGGSTVDLIALDARGGLVLVALDLVADERMLLRMLDAYSWCLERPEALRRRYRLTLPPAGPPRVVFVAERLPDSFLRTARHVRFVGARCLEYRYFELDGTRVLHLSPVPGDGGATAEDAGPVAGERSVQRREPSPAVAERERQHGQPPPASAAARRREEPRERRAPAAGAADGDKLRTIREYLQREFPTCIIEDFYAHDRTAQVFEVKNGLGTLVYRAAVAADFLEGQPEDEIKPFLARHKLAGVLRETGQLGVLVTTSGLRAERP